MTTADSRDPDATDSIELIARMDNLRFIVADSLDRNNPDTDIIITITSGTDIATRLAEINSPDMATIGSTAITAGMDHIISVVTDFVVSINSRMGMTITDSAVTDLLISVGSEVTTAGVDNTTSAFMDLADPIISGIDVIITDSALTDLPVAVTADSADMMDGTDGMDSVDMDSADEAMRWLTIDTLPPERSILVGRSARTMS